MFRLAIKDDIDQIDQIFLEAKKRMADEGIEQWNDERNIPNRNTAVEGVTSQTMYVYEINNKVAGVIVIDTDFYEGYPTAPDPKTTRALHKVAVSQNHLGHGVGSKLLKEAEIKIKEMGYNNIVIDTYSNNAKMVNLIAKCGYDEIGSFQRFSYLPNWIMYTKQV